MKIPLKWLAEYVDIAGLDPVKISDGLRFSGTENVLESGTSFENMVVGEIKKIDAHPDADKLQVAQVKISEKRTAKSEQLDGEILTIVCGAPNIKVGQKVPVALSGARFGDFVISKVKLRGVESNGMMCSEKELELGDDHDGIMILDKSAKVGTPLSVYLSKIDGSSTSINEAGVIDAELTPNRGDCLSMVGMAQEIAATFDRKLALPKFKKAEIKSKKIIEVEVREKDPCPRYIAKVIEGVKIGPSPKWMQERLVSAGVRPISNVVDVTNYVMLEWGQPLHAFDYDKLQASSNKQQGKKIIVRRANGGEKIETLDGAIRDLCASDLVIADSKKAIAVAGVMGGANTEVSDKTTTVVLEAAVFDGNSVRLTALRHANRTEASNRFEKGVPLNLPEIAIERAAKLLTEIPGGLAGEMPVVKPRAGENTDELTNARGLYPRFVGLRKSRVKEVLGVSIREDEIEKILRLLGFVENKIDFKKEARKHIGKPYIFGAKYSTYGDMAFDCSYFTEYIYYGYGKLIGHNALAQISEGKKVSDKALQPGDLLFIGGYYDKIVPNNYYRPTPDFNHDEVTTNEYPEGVRHVGLYIGDGRVVHARMTKYDFNKKAFVKVAKNQQKVVEEDVGEFIKLPGYLGAVRFIENTDDYSGYQVPWWRLDVKIEEDLIEEIARIYGYDKIPSTLPSGPMPLPKENKVLNLVRDIKTSLTGAGFSEVMIYSFVSEKEVSITGDKENAPKIINPLSSDNEYMRSNLVTSLLCVAKDNQENFGEIKIFEVANVYKKEKQELRLGVLVKISGKNEAISFYELKGALEMLLRGVLAFDVDIKIETKERYLEKAQSAELYVGKELIGHMGVVNKNVSEKFGLKTSVAVSEIFLEELVNDYGKTKTYVPVSKYPRSVRDINLVFDKSILAKEMVSKLKKAKNENLFDFSLLDVYEGKGLSGNEKSVTIRLIIGSDEGTLKEEEIVRTVDSSIKVLSGLGGKLRS